MRRFWIVLLWSAVLVAVLGLGAVGFVQIAGADPSLAVGNTYTGCLGPNSGTLSNVAIGDTPLRACKRSEIQVSWNQVVPRTPRVCLVPDIGGISDGSFGQNAWEGMMLAEDRLGVRIAYREAASADDYRPNIDAFVDEGCDLIITVGFLMTEDTAEAACDFPGQWFAIIDIAPWAFWPWADEFGNPYCDYSNVRGTTFAIDEAAFLAGYLAAGMSETGKVATFGGINIPPVMIFMDGFVYGVRHYNDVKTAEVQVIGWNPETAEGLFVGNWDSFEDGWDMGEFLYDEGADIIFPVAGSVGLGTAAAASPVYPFLVIGHDVDQYLTAPEYGPVWLTSVMKNMDAAAYNTIQLLVLGSLDADPYVGTLANGGVGLAPYHNNNVPGWLNDEVQQLAVEIIFGEVSVGG